ncbi:hypothetical protein JL722_14603 [Aureococcus anophagefferens]|nr:hypothetical protein JL722_14603 [Aureococcus anophagefferens]
MVSAALAWELVVTALLCASVATCILLDAASIYKVLQKIRLYVYGALLMTKRIIFIRHGESEWNLIFNKGPKPLLPFKAILGLVREIKMFFALDMGSVLYDSPLNQEGLEQAQELASLLRGDADWGDVPDPAQRDADAATLRGGADAPLSSVVASSNLRRAAGVRFALQARVGAKRAEDRVHVLNCLQEVSTNIDTISLVPPGALPQLPRVPAALQAPESFDLTMQGGNKNVRAYGQQRLDAFAEWAFTRPEDCVIVAGHSLFFQYFFKEYLPSDVDHVSKKFKVANGGIVACVLEKGQLSTGREVLAVKPESIATVHKGFDLKKKTKEKKAEVPWGRFLRSKAP